MGLDTGIFRQSRRPGLVSVLLLLATLSLGHAQDQRVMVPQIRDLPLVAAKTFTVVFVVPAVEFGDPRFTLGTLQEDLVLAAPPAVVRAKADPDSPDEVFTVTLGLRASKAGYLVLPASTLVFPSGEVWTSEPRILAVGIKGKPDAVPPELSWELPQGPLYAGQSFMVTLVMSKSRTLLIPKAIETASVTGMLFEEVQGSASSRTEDIANERFLVMPLASWMLTMGEAGTFSLPATLVRFADFELKPPPGTITIRPLPPELVKSGAVGEFSTNIILDRKDLYQNEAFTVTVRVDGRGNFKFLRPPLLQHPGLAPQSVQSNGRFEPGLEGYRGFREERYRVMASRPGTFALSMEGFSYLEPATGLITTLEGRRLEITIQPERKEENRRTVAVPPLGDRESDELAWQDTVRAHWLLVIAFAVLVILLANRRHLVPKVVLGLVLAAVISLAFVLDAQAHGSYEAAKSAALEAGGTIDQATFTELARSHDPDPQLWYALARSLYESGFDAAALVAVEQALELKDHRILREARAQLRERLGLVADGPQRFYVEPDLLLVLLGVGLVAAAIAWRLGRRRHLLIPVALVFLMAGLGAGGLLVAEKNDFFEERAWVRDGGTSLRKIPDAAVQGWLDVNAGESVRVLARSGSYLLVETSYNVRGWIRADSLHQKPLFEASRP